MFFVDHNVAHNAGVAAISVSTSDNCDLSHVLQMTTIMAMATTTTMGTAGATMRMSTATTTTVVEQQRHQQQPLDLVTLQQQQLQHLVTTLQPLLQPLQAKLLWPALH